MNLLNRKKINENNLLSATQSRGVVLNVNNGIPNQLKTKLKQKKILIVYKENDSFYVDHAAAYALGIINTRAIMTNNSKLIELPPDIHNKLKNNDEIEIQYVKKENKQKIKVFYTSQIFYIENSTAYALGMLSNEEFFNLTTDYFEINDEIFEMLKEKFDVEIISMNLGKEIDEHTHKCR